MVLNQCSTTTTTTTTTNAAVCSNCAAVERWLLHSVRREGILLRLCTTCVLRLHPHSFCPTCFTVYPPSPTTFITCNNCFSISHSSCVDINPQTPYICPMCQSPNAPIFLIDKVKDFDGIGSSGGGNGFLGMNEEKGIIRNANGVKILERIVSPGGVGNGVSRNDVRILEAAATISCYSMSEAALNKKCEAERRAREAVYTRKRAKQALEHMAVVVAKEKMRRGEGSGVEVDVSRLEGNVGGVMERRDNSLGNGGGGGVSAGVRSLERSEMRANGGSVREINAVECRGKEGSGGIRPQGNGATVDVNEHRGLGSSLDVGDLSVQKRDGGIVCDISSDPDQLNQSAERNLAINDGVVLPPPKENQMQVRENGLLEQKNNGLKH